MSADVTNTTLPPPLADTPPAKRGGLEVSKQQAAIVDHVLDNSLTMVDAGAGSGKTTTTIATVLELLELHPELHIDHFVLITFTNDAADELRSRLEEELTKRLSTASSPPDRQRWSESRERLPNAYIGTIHSFCRQVLRTFGYGSLVARNSETEFSRGLLFESIADAIEETFKQDPNHLLRDELGTSWHTYDLERIVREIYEDIRNRGLSPADVLTNTESQATDSGKTTRVALARMVLRTHQFYSQKKQEKHLLDAADLLKNTADVLRGEEGTDVVKKLAQRYAYLFVDEFQDTDRVQLQIVDALRPVLKAVLLVGDEKQSIYRFRGAGMRLSRIAAERGVTPLPLSVSRRPTQQLLKVQNSLFKSVSRNYPGLDQPMDRGEKAIDAPSDTPAAMTYLHGSDQDDRGLRIAATARKIRELIGQELVTDKGRKPIKPGDIAILLRANESVDAYEAGIGDILAQDSIVVRKEAGGQFFRRPEVIAVYRILRLLVDYPSDVLLAQALWTGLLSGDAAVIEREILQYGRTRDHQLTHWFEENHAQQAAVLRELRAALRSDNVSEIVERTYRTLGIRQHYQKLGQLRAVDNLDRLREMARMHMPNEQAGTLRGFVHSLQASLERGFDEPDAFELASGDVRPNHVRVMTVHRAKGLQFPIVFIPEVQKQLNGFSGNDMKFIVGDDYGLDVQLTLSYPSQSSQFKRRTGGDAEEERYEAMRVFYVAVTRAQNSVIFVGAGPKEASRPTTHPKYGWRDEIRRAWPELQKIGAIFEESDGNTTGATG